MPDAIYDAAVPTLLGALRNLSTVIDRGAEHAEREKLDPQVLVGARLYPDMFPFVRQVQIAADNAKGGAARLVGQTPPKFEDTEQTFAQLKERLAKTAAYISSLEAAGWEGAGARPILITMPSRTLSFRSGWDYLSSFVLPNVFFHSVTAYDILRHNGVKLGKGDYLGAIGQG